MPLDFQHQTETTTDNGEAAQKLYCKSCSHVITAQDWKIEINGDVDHTVFNPAGIVFQISCFRDAPGCWATGQPSSDFSWFKNYKWRIALCEGCGQQMGWLFTGIGIVPAFFGLIGNKLTDQPGM